MIRREAEALPMLLLFERIPWYRYRQQKRQPVAQQSFPLDFEPQGAGLCPAPVPGFAGGSLQPIAVRLPVAAGAIQYAKPGIFLQHQVKSCSRAGAKPGAHIAVNAIANFLQPFHLPADTDLVLASTRGGGKTVWDGVCWKRQAGVGRPV